MTLIPYTKHVLGNKLFTVEWELNPKTSGGEVGQPFDAVDCERLSIYALSNDFVTCVLQVSNWSDVPATPGPLFQIPGHYVAPYEGNALSSLGQMRWYWPSVPEEPAATVNSKIALLFKEL